MVGFALREWLDRPIGQKMKAFLCLAQPLQCRQDDNVTTIIYTVDYKEVDWNDPNAYATQAVRMGQVSDDPEIYKARPSSWHHWDGVTCDGEAAAPTQYLQKTQDWDDADLYSGIGWTWTEIPSPNDDSVAVPTQIP